VSVKAELLTWLLEPENPSARYLTLTEVLNRAPGDPDAAAARAAIPNVKPARAILDAQFAGSGYWIKPDVGYSPKYRATVWQVVFLAQLGAPPIEAVRRACDYVLDHSRRLTDRRGNLDGRFVAGKAARTAVNCLNGNVLWALGRLGHGDDPRTVEAREATAQAILKRGFACHYNGDLPCAWGDVKALRGFLEVPAGDRSAPVQSAIQRGIDFLLSAPVLEASYPTRGRVSDRWFKLGFPLGYQADVLEAMTALAQSGHAGHPDVQAGVEWLLSKQDTNGRWTLEQVPGKTWSSFGRVGQPHKWVTLRALGSLLAVGALRA
jgi:hypothetical protein